VAQTTITSSLIEISGPAGALRAFEARPSSGGPYPAVIVIQEWWGLNDHIKDVAERLARLGYVTVAPDLYSRQGNKVTTDPAEAGKLMGGLAKADGVADLLAVVAHLKTAAGVRGDRLGVTGFCMGGSFSALLACASTDIRAAAPFYGEIPDDADLAKLTAPLLYFYGTEDFWIKRADVDRLAATLTRLGKPGEVHIYEGAPHAFFNDTRKGVYRADEAQDAWTRTLELFEKRLKA